MSNCCALNGQERDLIRETEPARMGELDEDELIRLHSRIRRARKKHQKTIDGRPAPVSKSTAAEAPPAETLAQPRKSSRTRSHVSRLLEKLASEAAETLKQERLAAARANRGPVRPRDPLAATVDAGEARGHTQSPRAGPSATRRHKARAARHAATAGRSNGRWAPGC